VVVTSTLTIGDFSRATHLGVKTLRHYHDVGLLETVDATDVETRNRVIANHLARLESNLARTQEAVGSLRDLLGGPQASPAIEHRSVPAMSAAVITDIVDKGEALTWFQGAMGELAATLAAQDITPTGPPGVCTNQSSSPMIGEKRPFSSPVTLRLGPLDVSPPR